MKYKKTLGEFIEAMAELVEHRASGHVVLITDKGDWGKILLRKGAIYSVSLGDFRGQQVLNYLKPMPEIQYMFRPEKEGESARPTSAGSASMDNERFFNFFDHVLPKSMNPAPASQHSDSVTGQSGRKSVLVVDDSALARKVVTNLLSAKGYQVYEAKDGFEALGQLELTRPNLVILDLIMPKVDGYEVIERMKSNPAQKNIPVIMLTSRDSLMDKLKGKMSATDAYITKPVKEDELLTTISKLMAKSA
ncbi:MAG: response regulator [Chromatiales bacterium]|nr:response regulator [Chromatiales bacterium]